MVPSNNYLKVERYLHEHFDPDPRSNIFVVVVLEEETRTTESANALKMMAALHAYQQSNILTLPEYEQEVYRKGGRKQMDLLNFDKETVIVMDGTCIIDVPLAAILTEHKMSESSLTAVVRELDLSQKSKVLVTHQTHEIFGFSDLPTKTDMPTEVVLEDVRRLIIKTDN